MNSKLENVELQMENIKAEVLKLEELNKQRNEKIDLSSKHIESLLLELMSCVRKNQAEESIQTVSTKIENYYMKNSLTDMKLEDNQIEDDAFGKRLFNCCIVSVFLYFYLDFCTFSFGLICFCFIFT